MKYLTVFSESLFQAIEHYKAIDKRLALRFVQDVDRVKQKIIRFPKIGHSSAGFRKLSLNEFPYWFCYRENMDGELVAVVLFHHKQKLHRID